MANVESFVFYRSFYEAARELNDSDRLQMYDAIMAYALNHEEISIESGIARGMFAMAKPQLDANYKRRQDGKKGGRPRTAQSGEEPEDSAEKNHRLSETKTTGYANESEEKNHRLSNDCAEKKPNVNVNVNGNVNVNDNSRRFAKPSLNDVIEYCRSRNNNVDPERWYAYYESNGFKVGKNPMKDWRACIRTWERNETPKPQKKMPVYDTSLNADISAEEEEELLRLMGKA